MKLPKLTPRLIIISISIFLIVTSGLVITLLSVIDNTPPTVAFANPMNYDICSGTITVIVDATDTGSIGAKVSKVEIYIDDVLLSSVNGYSWDTTQHNDGQYSLSAKVFDKKGNTAENSINITVDNYVNPAPTDMFKILNYNILESGKNPEWKEVVKAENPDIAVFIETGIWDNIDNQLLDLYTKQFSGYFYEEAPYYSNTSQGVQYSTQGTAILSRYPILDFFYDDNVTLDDGSQHSLASDFGHAVIDINGKIVHVIGYHLKCCSGPTEQNRRERETEGFINYMDNLGDVPIIFLGDTNSMALSDNNQSIPEPGADFGYAPSIMLLNSSNPDYGQYSSKVHNFTDVYRHFYPNDTEDGRTLNVLNMHSRIDHIFVNQHFNNSLINSTVGTNTIYDDLASDHYSVDAFISITNISQGLSYKVSDRKAPNEKSFQESFVVTEDIPSFISNSKLEILTYKEK